MNELNDTLNHLGWFQMLLALGFVSSYAMALTPFAGPSGQWRSAAVAVLCGAGFSAITDPWVHGVFLVLMAVAGMALFVGVAWALSRLVGGPAALQDNLPAPAFVPEKHGRGVEPPLSGGAATGAH
jgi:hypothetical protein